MENILTFIIDRLRLFMRVLTVVLVLALAASCGTNVQKKNALQVLELSKHEIEGNWKAQLVHIYEITKGDEYSKSLVDHLSDQELEEEVIIDAMNFYFSADTLIIEVNGEQHVFTYELDTTESPRLTLYDKGHMSILPVESFQQDTLILRNLAIETGTKEGKRFLGGQYVLVRD